MVYGKTSAAWSPERIHQQLILLNIRDPPAPNTFRNIFYQNHAEEMWGIAFFTVPTFSFRILYVLVMIHHGTRRIVHVAVTESPNQFWQFRNVTPYNRAPKYIVHDNDPVFKSRAFKKLLDDSGVKAITTGKKLPGKTHIPSGLSELLGDYMVPLNERHLDRLPKEYVNAYYNPHRTHQGLGGATPIPHRQYLPTNAAETTLKKTRILGGLYHTLEKT